MSQCVDSELVRTAPAGNVCMDTHVSDNLRNLCSSNYLTDSLSLSVSLCVCVSLSVFLSLSCV